MIRYGKEEGHEREEAKVMPKTENGILEEVYPSLRVTMGKGDGDRWVAGVVQAYNQVTPS